MRPRRSPGHRGSRRGTILVLAAVAFLLQGVHLFGFPQWPEASEGGSPSASPVPPPPSSSPGSGGPGQPGPTLTVPPPPGVPIPEGAVLLYEQSPSAAAAGPGPRPGGRALNPPEILRGLILLHDQGRLELTPEQARRLRDAVRGLGGAYADMRSARDEILQVLTPEQLRWLEEHPPAEGEIPAGAPEQNATGPARKALESLGP